MERDPIDVMGPWTIKSVSTATRDKVTLAARKEGLTVGQWLERRVEEWLADGSPMPVAAGGLPLSELERLSAIAAETANAGGKKLPGDMKALIYRHVKARLALAPPDGSRQDHAPEKDSMKPDP
jgi:hypothetical protein